MVAKKIKAMKDNKSPGVDGIPAKLLMETVEQISIPLARVFNLSIKEGVVPFEWKEANIIPLFKKGSRNKSENVVSTLANYRLPTPSKASKRKAWLYEEADWDGMRSFLASVECTALSKGHSADLAWSCVKDNLADAMDFYVTAKQTNHRYSGLTSFKPWFNELCREAVQYKQKAYKKWQKRRTKDSWTLYMQSKSACQRSLRRARLQFSQHLEQELKRSDNKQCWKLVKAVTSAIPPLRHDGHIYNKASEKAQLLNNLFAANSQIDDGGKTPPKLHAKTNATLSSIKFRPKVVLKKLRTLNMSKANGPDGISSTVLKKRAPELALVLAKLFQISFDTWTVPSEWKTVHVIAVHKKGSKHDPSNYRPISLYPRRGVSMIHQTTDQYRCYQ